MKSILLVGLGGGIGSIFRYLMSVMTSRYFAHSFPFATFVVNITGCLLIGLLMGMMGRQSIADTDFKLLLVTGFCGGYTTFSAFSLENIQLIQSGHVSTALWYIGLSVILGVLAVGLGLYLTKV